MDVDGQEREEFMVAQSLFIDKLLTTHGLSPVQSKVREDELLQLIGQYLCNKGYKSAYNELTKASGIKLEHESATEMRNAILEGNWDLAELALETLRKSLPSKKHLPEITFFILEQRFLELLESNEVIQAVSLLRNRLTPLQVNRDRVHLLASCIMCRTPAEIRAQAGGWSGANSRLALVERIQQFLPPQTMLPPRRLEQIVAESLKSQVKNCVFHNQVTSADDISLLENHCCSLDTFPVMPIQRLRPNQSEVWGCQFSPNGHFLVTCGKDCNIEIYTVNSQARTVTHSKSILTNSHQNFLCWAPDSSKFAVCFSDEQSIVIVFDPLTGREICQYKVNEDESFSTAAFFADSRTLAFGGIKGTFYIMDTMDEGRILTMVEGYRVQAMAAVYRMQTIATHESAFREPSSGEQTTDTGATQTQSTAANRQFFYAESLSQYDELLIADTMHRVSLFRFGYTAKTSVTNGAGTDLTTASSVGSTGPTAQQSQTMSSSTGAAGSIISQPPEMLSEDIGGYIRRVLHRNNMPESVTVTPAGFQFPQAWLSPVDTAAAIRNRITAPGAARVEGSINPGQAIYFAATAHPGWLGHDSGARDQQHQQQQPTTQAAFLFPNTLRLTASHILTPTLTASSVATSTGIQAPQPLLLSSQGTTSTASVGPSGGTTAAAPAASMVYFTPAHHHQLTTDAATSTTSTSTSGVPVTVSAPRASSRMSTSTIVMTSSSGTSTENGAAVSVAATPATATNGTNLTSDSQNGSANGTANGASNANNTYAFRDQTTLFRENNPIQSLVISRSGRQVLVGTQKLGLQLWDLDAAAIVQRFVGMKQENHKLHPAIGGVNDDFVVCGGEDGRMHYWRASAGAYPIHTVQAAGPSNPSSIVNWVSWNPVVHDMIASVNDEGELFIWAPLRFADAGMGDMVTRPSDTGSNHSNSIQSDLLDMMQE